MRAAPPKGSRWLSQLRQVGPGAIVASTSIGAGETVLAVRAGAWGGYDLLWLILVATITKSFLTLYLLGRYAVISGQSVAEKLIDFPGPRGWLLWLILGVEAVVAPFVFVVIAVPSGRLMTEILASVGLILSYKWFALAFVSLAILAGIFQRYETLEKSQTGICLVLLACTMLASILVQPEIGPIIKGFFRFGYFPDYPEWLPLEIKSRSRMLEMASVFGYAGSIAMNYVVYSNWVVIKGWTVGRLGPDRKRALKPLKLDVFFTASLILLVTVAFMIAGAAILAPLQKIPRGYDLLTEQAHIFAQISPLMIPLYYVIILAALWGSLNALPEIYGRGAHSFLTTAASEGERSPLFAGDESLRIHPVGPDLDLYLDRNHAHRHDRSGGAIQHQYRRGIGLYRRRLAGWATAARAADGETRPLGGNSRRRDLAYGGDFGLGGHDALSLRGMPRPWYESLI